MADQEKKTQKKKRAQLGKLPPHRFFLNPYQDVRFTNTSEETIKEALEQEQGDAMVITSRLDLWMYYGRKNFSIQCGEYLMNIRAEVK